MILSAEAGPAQEASEDKDEQGDVQMHDVSESVQTTVPSTEGRKRRREDEDDSVVG